jgi:hypothetical protein
MEGAKPHGAEPGSLSSPSPRSLWHWTQRLMIAPKGFVVGPGRRLVILPTSCDGADRSSRKLLRIALSHNVESVPIWLDVAGDTF